MHSHTHDHAVQHFSWCSAKTKSDFCSCILPIYLMMALVGSITFYFEWKFAHDAHASGPIADAFHIASDTGTDLVAFFGLGLAGILGGSILVKRITAWIQVSLLTCAIGFVGFEIFDKYQHSKEVKDALVMALAGGVGTLGNGFRLWLLNLKRGEWDPIRVIQDRHARSDLYYSMGVVCAGLLIFVTSWGWWDWVILSAIFCLLIKLWWQAAVAVWTGEIPHHH